MHYYSSKKDRLIQPSNRSLDVFNLKGAKTNPDWVVKFYDKIDEKQLNELGIVKHHVNTERLEKPSIPSDERPVATKPDKPRRGKRSPKSTGDNA